MHKFSGVIKNFIERNIPVFAISGITLAVFILIIVSAAGKKPNGPILTEIQEEQLVADYTYTFGPKDAPIVIVEFSDFECPACRIYHPQI